MSLLALSTNAMWISKDDYPWLVTWLASEYKTGGVPIDETAVADEPTEGNCAVAGVFIQWDFIDSWEATILQGEQKGKVVRSEADGG